MGVSVLIYSEKITPRLTYIFDIVFKSILQFDFVEFTTDINVVNNFDGAVVNYSQQKINNKLQIIPCPILFEEKITPQQISIEQWNNLPVFFKTNDGDFPFDLMGAAFYLITRCEEYFSITPDNHGRFSANNSLAYKHNFLHRALIHHYAFCIESKMELPKTMQEKVKYKPLITFDIDNAYAYLYKGLYRTTGAAIKDIVRFDFENLYNRISTLCFIKKDPFDTYAYIDAQATNDFEIAYFFMTANLSQFDRNMDYRKKQFQKLVTKIASQYQIGIHPSYYSNEQTEKLQEEIKRLATMSKKKIIHSRQHFLRLKFPNTFQQLIKEGIEHDYSLGYADKAGFRASIAVPFAFFDLTTNVKTNLILHPITFMDATFKFYEKKTNEQTLKTINDLKNEIQQVNGQLHVVLHNETLSEKGDWKGWRNIFENIIS